MNIFFVRGFFDDLKFTGLSQGWTLTVEECFYFLAPLFFIQIQKNKKNIWRLPLLLLSVGILLVLVFSHISFFGFYENFTFMFLYTFTGRCIEFFIGIWVATLCLQTTSQQKFTKPIFTLLGAVIAITGIIIMANLPLSKEHPFGLYHPVGIFSNNIILPIGVAMLFYGLINEASWFKNFLSTPIMQLLGKSSYIFYLVHIGFISHTASVWADGWVNRLYDWLDAKEYNWIINNINSNVITTGIVFIILNIVSITLYKLIEHPVNEWIRKSSFLESRKQLQ
jgi:peptidoglycan/LPS O-acetylase OafA/YrhL